MVAVGFNPRLEIRTFLVRRVATIEGSAGPLATRRIPASFNRRYATCPAARALIPGKQVAVGTTAGNYRPQQRVVVWAL